MPITLPLGVKVELKGGQAVVTGPKGELKHRLRPEIAINQEGNQLIFTPSSDSKQDAAFHGLTRSLVANMVEGVTKGFEKTLEIVGVGYRAEKDGDKLVFRLGFSHLVEKVPPPGITFSLEGANRVKVTGINKQVVGQVAAEIRAIRPPDTYKGKGVRYAGEVITLKAGKAVGKGMAE